MTDRRSEHAIQNEALVALSALPRSLVFRNNTGQAWQGERIDATIGGMIEVEPGMVILRRARPVKFGLVGSGDILGAVDGHPVAVEMKSATGHQRELQRNFERAWTAAGGIYILARTVREAVGGVCEKIIDLG